MTQILLKAKYKPHVCVSIYKYVMNIKPNFREVRETPDFLLHKPKRVLNVAYPDTEFSEHNGSYLGSSNLALFFVERSSTPSPAKNE